MFFETLKANLIIFLFFIVVCGIGYWAIVSLDVRPEPDTEGIEVRPVIVNDPTEYDPNAGSATSSTPEVVTTPAPQTTTSTPSSTTTTGGVYDDLIADLQELINNNILMKKGSRGTRVGTVQEFLNIYSGTDSKIDNDYGATTESQIKTFQKTKVSLLMVKLVLEHLRR